MTDKFEFEDKLLREFAILILDDNNGITFDAASSLYSMLRLSGNEDIIEAIIVEDNRIFLPESWVEDEKEKKNDERDSTTWTESTG